MFRKESITILLILTFFMTMLTGCWNRRELDRLGIVSAIGLDKKGNKILVSAQVIEPGEIATGMQGIAAGRAPVTLYEEERAESVFEAMRSLTTKAPRKLYFSHTRMVVIGEKLAKHGIGKVIDFLSRDYEFRRDFYLVIIKDKEARQALNIWTSLEKIPANKLNDSLETSEKYWAPTIGVHLDELIQDLVTEDKQLVLTGLEISGNYKKGESQENVKRIDSPAELLYSQLAVFKKDKLVGWLNEEEGRGYNYTQGEVKNTVKPVPCPTKGSLTVEIIRTKTKLDAQVKQGRPQVNVHVRTEANVGEVNCQIDLLKEETIHELEKKLEQAITKTIKSSLHKAQKQLKTDIFGFGDVIHRQEPKLWKKLKPNWDKQFVDLPVNVKVTAKIRRTGTVNQSFIEQMKE